MVCVCGSQISAKHINSLVELIVSNIAKPRTLRLILRVIVHQSDFAGHQWPDVHHGLFIGHDLLPYLPTSPLPASYFPVNPAKTQREHARAPVNRRLEQVQ